MPLRLGCAIYSIHEYKKNQGGSHLGRAGKLLLSRLVETTVANLKRVRSMGA